MSDIDLSANNVPNDLYGLTVSEYTRLLIKAQNRFDFVEFSTRGLNPGEIILRHDIDRSPFSALEVARINYSLGIRATFFVRTRSENYNFLDPMVQDYLNEIVNLGQSLGLHLEPTEADLESVATLESAIHQELKIWGIPRNNSEVSSFAFHNTSPKSLKFIELKYAGLFNAYSNYFKLKDRYVSDSGGKWRFRTLDSVLDDPETDCLQLLIHTDWWRTSDAPPFSKIHNSAMEDFDRTIDKYVSDISAANLKVDKGSAGLLPVDISQQLGVEPGIVELLWNLRKFKVILKILTGANQNIYSENLTDIELEQLCLRMINKI